MTFNRLLPLPADRSMSPFHRTHVGASLLANSGFHSASMLADTPLSRAGSLPHMARRIEQTRRAIDMATCGEVLVKLLEDYGVEQVFGIPGVHTVELYRGLARSSINHVTPRHEQGAGFMADGYARTRGKPGVCFIITGPGMTNITTAMGQAYADSIPMLVISSVQIAQPVGRRSRQAARAAEPERTGRWRRCVLSYLDVGGGIAGRAGSCVCAVPGRASTSGAHRNSAGRAGGRGR